MKSDFPKANEAARFLRTRWPQVPRVAIVLGSGLGEVVRQLCETQKTPYAKIPHFPKPTVAGHGGVLHWGKWRGVPVAILEGRAHLYEGRAPAEVVFAARVLALAGVKTFVLTCAAGGIAPRGLPGSLMIFSDHLNYQGSSPLAGAFDERWGARFVDLSEAYDRGLRAKALRAARASGVNCIEGVYAAILGPNYETPAEIRALGKLGADAVGMSTVPEVIAARQLGVRVLAVAAISNRAAGLSKRPLSHEEVLEAGAQSAKNLVSLIDGVLKEGL